MAVLEHSVITFGWDLAEEVGRLAREDRKILAKKMDEYYLAVSGGLAACVIVDDGRNDHGVDELVEVTMKLKYALETLDIIKGERNTIPDIPESKSGVG